MRALFPALSLLVASNSFAQIVSVRAPAAPLAPGLGSAPSALSEIGRAHV